MLFLFLINYNLTIFFIIDNIIYMKKNTSKQYMPKTPTIIKVFYFLFAFAFALSVQTNANVLILGNRIINYGNVLKGYEKKKNEEGLLSLKNVNEKIFAWITCEDLNISLPLLKTNNKEEEDFYINHDFEKYENPLGAPYIESDCVLNQTTNCVIAGHSQFTHQMFNNMGTTTIFGNLISYLSPNGRFNYNINIQTETENLSYKVISCFKYNKNENYTDQMKVYLTKNITNENTFNDFYQSLLNLSAVDTGVTASYGDKFITLFTCLETNLNYRIVVVAKQIN